MAKKKKRTKPKVQAKRDVRLFQQPMLDELARQRTMARGDTRQYTEQVGTLYDALAQALGDMQGPYQDQALGIANQYKDDIGFLQDLVGGAVPASEQAAAGGLAGALGAGTLGLLSTDRQRQLDYGQSAMRQGELERLSTIDNANQDLQQLLQDLQQQRLDIKGQTGDLRKQRLDEILQRNFENKMAKGGLDLQKRQAEALAQFLGAEIGGVGHPGGGGGGGGGGRPGGGGGGGGGGGQQGPVGGRQALSQTLAGDVSFGKNRDAIMKLLAKKSPKAENRIIKNYGQVAPGETMQGPYSPAQIRAMLKAVYQKRSARAGGRMG